MYTYRTLQWKEAGHIINLRLGMGIFKQQQQQLLLTFASIIQFGQARGVMLIREP